MIYSVIKGVVDHAYGNNMGASIVYNCFMALNYVIRVINFYEAFRIGKQHLCDRRGDELSP